MRTNIALMCLATLALSNPSLAEEPQPIPSTSEELGKKVDALNPSFIFVIGGDGATYLFFCDQQRDCETDLPRPPDFVRGDGLVWQRYEGSGHCDEVTTASGYSVIVCPRPQN